MNSPKHMIYRRQTRPGFAALWVAVFLGAVAVSSAQDTNRWNADIAAGLTLTGGNSDSVLGTLAFKAERLWERDELRFGVRGAYGKSDGEVNNQLVAGTAQYNHLFNERFYGLVRLDGLHDGVADVEYRLTLSPGAGYYFIKNDRTRLNGEVAPAFIMEKVGGDESQYFAIRFTERWEQKLSDTARFWEQVDYLPQVDDFTDNFLINAEVGIEVAINTRLSLREVFLWNYDNQPASGRKNYDIKSITALVYKF